MWLCTIEKYHYGLEKRINGRDLFYETKKKLIWGGTHHNKFSHCGHLQTSDKYFKVSSFCQVSAFSVASWFMKIKYIPINTLEYLNFVNLKIFLQNDITEATKAMKGFSPLGFSNKMKVMHINVMSILCFLGGLWASKCLISISIIYKMCLQISFQPQSTDIRLD